MFMTASRIKKDGKILLKLNIHEYEEGDIPFLDKLGINEIDASLDSCRCKYIHSKDAFLAIRSELFAQYKVTEKGHKAYLVSR